MDLYQSLVTVNPVTLIAMICNLFLQMLIVKIFFLDKIKAILDQRREAADKQITDAEAAKAEAQAKALFGAGGGEDAPTTELCTDDFIDGAIDVLTLFAKSGFSRALFPKTFINTQVP